MNLQEIFYLFSIAFFVSIWLVLIIAVAALYLLTKKFRQAKNDWQQSWFSKPLSMAAGSLPLLTVLTPIFQKGWQLWQQKKDNKGNT